MMRSRCSSRLCIKKILKGAGGVTEVAECLPSKHKEEFKPEYHTHTHEVFLFHLKYGNLSFLYKGHNNLCIFPILVYMLMIQALFCGEGSTGV
jgi:hypothetical protein